MAGYRILVVDDHKNTRDLFKLRLGQEGFEVLVAEDGAAGLAAAADENPDAILLDWVMPGIDGLQVLLELKHKDATKDIPVFMFTTRGKANDVETAIANGATGYFTKPVDPKDVGRELNRRLGST